ncbi:hypothetical protein BFG60_0198 [Microcystis aeruginosa NIES-98]|nr:hypothetical protein BFG60_0198 [Microcystis aeruginosa NIES-98]
MMRCGRSFPKKIDNHFGAIHPPKLSDYLANFSSFFLVF